MSKISPYLNAYLDVAQPIQEICSVISAMLQYHPQNEVVILTELQKAIDKKIQEVTREDGKSVLQPNTECENKK